MKNCPKCNAQVKDNVKFCNFCGFNIRKHEEEKAQAVQSEFCPECGAKISEGAFCPECGYKLDGTVHEPLFDFSEDTVKYADEALSGFDEQIKKQEEAKKKVDEEKKEKAIDLFNEAFEGARAFDDAIPLLREVAETGDVDFQLFLGYSHTQCRQPNYKEAVYWYQKAADQGNGEAYRRLFELYENGWGVAADPKKATDLMTKAAELGDCEAQYRLGEWYEEGSGVEKDYQKAMYWYEIAVKSCGTHSQDAKRKLQQLKKKK